MADKNWQKTDKLLDEQYETIVRLKEKVAFLEGKIEVLEKVANLETKNVDNGTTKFDWGTVTSVPLNTTISDGTTFTTDDPNFFKDSIAMQKNKIT